MHFVQLVCGCTSHAVAGNNNVGRGPFSSSGSSGNTVFGSDGGDGGDNNGNTANGGSGNSGDFSGNGGIAVGNNGNGGNGGNAVGGEYRFTSCARATCPPWSVIQVNCFQGQQ